MIAGYAMANLVVSLIMFTVSRLAYLLIIVFAPVVGVLLFAIFVVICCICCCACKGKKKPKR